MVQILPLTIIYVDAAALPGGDGSFSKPFKTNTEAVNAAGGNGSAIIIKGAIYNEAPIWHNKRGYITLDGSGLVLIQEQ